MRSPGERAKRAALVVVGPSGCGKSSPVRAGLVPVMAAEHGWCACPRSAPGADPVAALAAELVARRARRRGLDAGRRTRSARPRRADRLADDLLLADPHAPARHLLVVVDQFEELLT